MDRWQYLLLLGGCLAITAPLEVFGGGVYRQPMRVLRSVAPVAVAFLIWDAIAIARHVWTYNNMYISGLYAPFSIPIEEVLFFLVIPMCALLTYSAVSTIIDFFRRRPRGAATIRDRAEP
jgi:lycopene cyclase domain-containing protein